MDELTFIDRIKKINTPLLVIHGNIDKIIPQWHGIMLFKNANEPKKFINIKGAGHNNIPQVAGSNLWIILQNFIQNKVKK